MNRFVVYVFVLFLFSNCKKDNPFINEEAANQNTSTVLNVNVQIVNDQKFNKQLITNGKVEAQQKSELRFTNGEKIVKINVRNGQEISKGQLIAYQDNILLRNEIQKAQTDLDKALSKFEEEKINYGFSDSSDKSISPAVLKNIKFKSGVQDAENVLVNAQLQLEQTYLKAPFSGLIANLETKEGDYITSNEAFCTLINKNKLCLLYTSPSPRDQRGSRMPSSA